MARTASDAAASQPPKGPDFEIQRHDNPGQWRATVRFAGGEREPIHRFEDPLGEARAQLATCGAHEPHLITVVAAGLGFLTEAAYERFPNARIVVLEPLRPFAENAVARTPAIYSSGRVTMLTSPDFGGVDLWRFLDVEDPSEPEPTLLLNPVLQRATAAATARAVLLARRASNAARMNARARRENAGRYLLNTLRNLPHVVNGLDAGRLAGQFTDVPAVVVGAGPSLERSLPALRAISGRAIILASDTSWRPLVAAGIDPHVVVAVDPSPLNSRHLSTVTPHRDTWVLAEGSVDPDALRTFSGRVGAFRVGTHQPWPWLLEHGVDRPLVQVWGSVLTATFDLALSFGCDPVVFVGADLAFTDRRPYCRGTSFEADWAHYAATGMSLRQIWESMIATRVTLSEPDVTGASTLSAANLVEFRNWIVAHAAKHQDRRVLNATGAGILVGPGIEQTDLDTALGPHPDRGDSVRDTLRRHVGLRLVSSHHHSVAEAIASVEEQLSGDAENASEAPLADWLAFGRPSLTVEAIRSAIADGRAGLEHPGQASDRSTEPGPTVRMYAADRAARMRAILSRDTSGLDGCSTAAADDVRRTRDEIDRDLTDALQTLQKMPSLVSGTAVLTPNQRSITWPLLSQQFAWTPDAAAWVAFVEERLIERGHVPPFASVHLDTSEPEDDDSRAREQLTRLDHALRAEQRDRELTGATTVVTLARPFQHQDGYCYTVLVGTLVDIESDRPDAITRSPLVLLEDGVAIGSAHTLHDVIRRQGQGGYSHWQDVLFFSSSDGSDPNHNGRRYSLIVR